MAKTNDYKNQMHESAHALATMVVHENNHETTLLSPEIRRKKIEEELIQNAESLQTKMYEGLKACIHGLEKKQDPILSVDKLVHELHKCFKSLKSTAHLQEIGKNFLQDSSWKKQLGISNTCMQTLYQGAYALFEGKDYAEAEKAFYVICSIDPTQFAYWIGLGHSSFQEHNYDQAINAYSMASTLDPANVWPHIWAANCFEAQKDFGYAEKALHEALLLQKSQTPKNHELIHSLEARMQKIHSR